MKILVIGGTGFIGSHIIRTLLDKSCEVRALVRSAGPYPALAGVKIACISGDLNDRASLVQAMKGCEALFHAGGHYPVYSFHPREQLELAIRQQSNLFEAAAQTSTLKKIVYTSSLSTIGISPSGIANEENPYDPKDYPGLYYQIKYELEQEAFRWIKKGLPITIVNPTMITGDFDVKPTSGILIVTIASGKVPFLFDAKMNTVDVHDVAAAQWAALEKGKIGERYILGGHNTTVWELSRRIARLAQVKPPKFQLPLSLGPSLAWTSEIIAYYLLRKNRPLIPRIGIDFLRYGGHYDSSKAIRELGLSTTPLEESLSRAYHWFKTHGYL